ncbi:saccharopine dehydrogenase family protein [Arthrobacter sp. 7Tela_A1]|uniref:saccharopine dehydrogenase family protein n=1 Tax=Arthrobacter sp. 7Tela_A1 TaxID=3093745 RepID=UPI003BB780E0
MTGSIVVFGATGYTGRLVVESLLKRGVRPVLAGRNERNLRDLAAPGQLDYRSADVRDSAAMRALLSPGDVLVSTVGPFERYGHAAAQAAVEAGAHYLDSTGEVGFVHDLRRRLSRQAQEQGITMVPAFGYDYVPGFLAGTLAMQRAGSGASALRVGYFAAGTLRRGLSQGTRATLAEIFTKPAAVYRDRTLGEGRIASTLEVFRVLGQERRAFLAPGTEVLFMPEAFPQLESVEVFNGWFPALSKVVQPVTWLAAQVEKVPWGQRALKWAGSRTIGPPGGPDESERGRTLSLAAAKVLDQSGRPLAAVQVLGPSVYTLTGELLAEGAAALQEGKALRHGVLGPVEAFGPEGLVALCAGARLAPIPG